MNYSVQTGHQKAKKVIHIDLFESKYYWYNNLYITYLNPFW